MEPIQAVVVEKSKVEAQINKIKKQKADDAQKLKDLEESIAAAKAKRLKKRSESKNLSVNVRKKHEKKRLLIMRLKKLRLKQMLLTKLRKQKEREKKQADEAAAADAKAKRIKEEKAR